MKDFVSLNMHKDVSNHISNQALYRRLSNKYKEFVASSLVVTKTTTYPEECKDPRWIDAMKSQIEALISNHTWNVVILPKGKKPIGCSCIYKIKYKSLREVERFKARLVAKGYNQKRY